MKNETKKLIDNSKKNSSLKVWANYATGFAKSLVIGTLPVHLRFRAENKYLNNLEKELFFGGTIEPSYGNKYFDSDELLATYSSGTISAITNSLAIGTFAALKMYNSLEGSSSVLGNVFASLVVGLSAGWVNFAPRYIASNSYDYIKLPREDFPYERPEFAPLAGTILAYFPAKLGESIYTKLKSSSKKSPVNTKEHSDLYGIVSDS